MKATRDNKIWTTIYGLFSILGIAVCFAGCILAFAGLMDVAGFGDMDADSFLHEPTIYFDEMREIVGKAVNEIVVGMAIVVLGAVVITISMVRFAATKNEKRQIIELEKRIAKLEKANDQRKKA